jgi:hypothetical protein
MVYGNFEFLNSFRNVHVYRVVLLFSHRERGGGQETGTAEGVPCTLQQNCRYQEEAGWFNVAHLTATQQCRVRIELLPSPRKPCLFQGEWPPGMAQYRRLGLDGWQRYKHTQNPKTFEGLFMLWSEPTMVYIFECFVLTRPPPRRTADVISEKAWKKGVKREEREQIKGKCKIGS